MTLVIMKNTVWLNEMLYILAIRFCRNVGKMYRTTWCYVQKDGNSYAVSSSHLGLTHHVIYLTLMMEAVFSTEMLTVHYQTTRRDTLAGRNPNSAALTTVHRVGKYFSSYIINLGKGKGKALSGHNMKVYMRKRHNSTY